MVGVLRAPRSAGPHPVVILVPGLDSAKEELRPTEQMFLDRGLATFAVDGPGQGEAEYDLPIRPDWEVPGRGHDRRSRTAARGGRHPYRGLGRQPLPDHLHLAVSDVCNLGKVREPCALSLTFPRNCLEVTEVPWPFEALVYASVPRSLMPAISPNKT